MCSGCVNIMKSIVRLGLIFGLVGRQSSTQVRVNVPSSSDMTRLTGTALKSPPRMTGSFRPPRRLMMISD